MKVAASALPVRADRVRHVGTARGATAGTAEGPITLLAADLSEQPELWEVYRRGLRAAYTAIGAAQLAPELSTDDTTVVLATTRTGQVVGGCRLRAGTDIHRYAEITRLAEGIDVVIGARERDGVQEATGSWLVPEATGVGLGTALLQGVLRVAAGTRRRWTVGLANQFNKGPCMRAGFVPDPCYADLPFPDERFRSTLVWYDHGGHHR